MDITIDVDLAQAARELNLPLESVQRTVALLDDGNTVPFITRYRKDHTGALNEEQIRRIQERVGKLRALAERKRTILRSIQTQGQLTESLDEQIRAANSPKRLEDLYLPFKPKKQTLATAARQKGLEPLAAQVLQADPEVGDLHGRAQQLVAPDRGLNSPDDVLAGVRHIIAEWFSERADVRGKLRSIFHRSGKVICSRMEPAAARELQAEPHPASPPAASPPAASPPAASPPAASPPAASPPAVTSPEQETPQSVASAAPAAGDIIADAAELAEMADPDLPFGESSGDVSGSDAEPISTDRAEGDSAAIDVAEQPSGTGPDQPSAPGGDPPQGETHEVTPSDAVVETPRPADRVAKSKVKRGPLAAAVTKNAKKEKKRQRVEAAFKDYFNFQDTVARIPHHRVLAINRGERARILRVKVEGDVAAMGAEAELLLVPIDHPHGEFLRSCVRDALVRLIVPSLERELRREMMERAEEHAVEVFARNLRTLLLQPPVHGHRVLAIDPGFRSGCKLLALDEFGNVLGHEIIHVIGKEEWIRAGRAKLAETIRKHQLDVIAIGNGAACRETEQLVVDVMANELQEDDVVFLVVNEAGASVYSTSPLGREELPTFDPVLRSAVSIGRRLLDPLSELVKINPANIGVGMYQHDVKAKHLRDSLDAVVESCVNYVGVDANTASPALLRYVSGMNQLNARRLVEYRSKQGPFRTREQLKLVPGLGEAAFVQAAGFLKIANGDNPLDVTWIHPESYALAVRVLEKAGCDLSDLASSSVGGRTEEPAAESESDTPPPSWPTVCARWIWRPCLRNCRSARFCCGTLSIRWCGLVATRARISPRRSSVAGS
jgi:protein Tex